MTRRRAAAVTWVVGPDDEGSVLAVVARLKPAGVGGCAVQDGRVFVDGVRVQTPDQPVFSGQRIDVYSARDSTLQPQVLDERGGLLAVLKPPGLPTEPDRHGREESLLCRLAAQLRVPRDRLHAASRLDLGVSGLVLVACTAEARRAVQTARGEARLRHRYLALAAARPPTERGQWTSPVPGRVRRGPRRTPQPALTHFACAAQADPIRASVRLDFPDANPTLLGVEPQTGRTHQIRIHASLANAPLLGDRGHGGPTRALRSNGEVVRLDRIALHMARILLWDVRGVWRVQAPLPADLVGLWRDLGGREEDQAAAMVGDRL